jgi:arginine:ornithine antiporter/lysine permease
VLCLLVLVTVFSYGILLQPDLAALATPSMAGVMEAIVGPWGRVFISAGLLISIAGNYLSWSLLAAEVLHSAARNQTLPAFLARENANQVPYAALWLSNIVIQAFLLVTWFAQYAFTLALKMTSAMTLIPYLLVAAYGLRLAWTGETYTRQDPGRYREGLIAAIATLYAAAMIYAGDSKFLLLAALLYAPGTWLYFAARREQAARVFNSGERWVFAAICATALAALYRLVSGAIVI